MTLFRWLGIPLCTIFFTVFFSFQQASARHIVGGEMIYECLGNNSYRFTMFVYRDCEAAGGAQFDSFGFGATTGTVSIFNGNNLVTNINLDTPEVTTVPPSDENPCLEIPPNVCVERGVYVFTQELPQSSETYTITYSRCCRNNTITNIFNPGDAGATYTIDITPTAQMSCNNSPIFTNFPEILICSGEPIVFDHSATDADGDQLVYSFCSPFFGGGRTGNGGSLDSPSPNPDAPPPYNDINFRAPDFTAGAPLAGDPVVKIDPVSGLITGIPNIRGQFVVGVCVEEFRNGELLSTVRRDFQFNVEICDPVVTADIVEDEFLGVGEFQINLCGETEFQFANESNGDIRDFKWEFDFGAQGIQTFEEWEPLVVFPDTGLYVGALIINEMESCGDTATIFVNVFPDLEADFEISYDTCLVGPVDFRDLSITNGSDIVAWDWSFGDGNESDVQDPFNFYEEIGSKRVSLAIVDNNGCEESTDLEFDWTPNPIEINVQPNTFILCSSNPEVTFTNLTSPIDASYSVTWDFGDGGASNEISPSYIYENTGTYTVGLEVISPFDCAVSETFNNWITIKESPTADFSFNPDGISNLSPQVFFNDQSSSDVTRWQWDFGGQGASRDQNPLFVFRDSGFQQVVLLVTAENGCTDTTFAFVDVVPLDSYTLPNAFTPNNDDKNDIYLGVGALENISDFNMKIWDRWGAVIFESDSAFEGWNGRKFNSGPLLAPGVYPVFVSYESARDGTVQHKAFATLIR